MWVETPGGRRPRNPGGIETALRRAKSKRGTAPSTLDGKEKSGKITQNGSYNTKLSVHLSKSKTSAARKKWTPSPGPNW